MRNLFMRVSKLRLALHFLLIFGVAAVSSSHAQSGKDLFEANCKACHSPGDKVVIGPGLAGIEDRVPSKDWLYQWIQNSRSLIDAGDAYAVKVFKENNEIDMPAQAVSKEEIDAILTYIKDYKIPEVVVKDPEGGTPGAPAGGTPGAPAGNTLLYALIIACITLLLVIWFLSSTKKSLKVAVADKLGEPIPVDRGLFGNLKHWMSNNKRAVAVIVLLIVALGLRQAWYSVIWIGVHQGYEPTQPIAFPHDLHAGKNGINCVYCHSSAEKGKTAGIPSLNVCMNCHVYVAEGERSGSSEINKIYEYLDYDPETKTYGDNPKPVKWVRIHNLPDLAYFNHSQHVKVGGIACQTCHGAVEEMDVLHQESTLTMGWCVDCHRNQPVKMEGNGYYDYVHNKLSEEHKAKFMKDGKITVEELGGLECARCHY
ncbi:MAG: c-type cytochrome [Flavobacteriales bacterium]|nr:c-type cytochrome [Flavobacteriales bacterium]